MKRLFLIVFILIFALLLGFNNTVAQDTFDKPLKIFTDEKQTNELKKTELILSFGSTAFNQCFTCASYDLANPFAYSACLAQVEHCLTGETSNTTNCTDGYISAGRCVSMDTACRELYGEHTYSTGDTLDNKIICECAAGFGWNNARTKCVQTVCPENQIYYSQYKTSNGEFLHGRCQTYDDACESEYGENSQFSRLDGEGNYFCLCQPGWDWNQAGSECSEEVEVLGIELLPEEQEIVTAEKNNEMAERLKGRILLQVEENGEAWYVNPVDQSRHYMGRPADAFRIMRELGLGITNKDYEDFNGIAPERLSGRILLKVEDSGQAHYVNPIDLKTHYMGRPADAFRIMREFGLGITNSDLNKIPIKISIEGTSSADDIAKANAYVVKEIVAGTNGVLIKEIEQIGELFRVVLVLPNEQEMVFYLSKDGEEFILAVIDINEIEDTISNARVKEVKAELFVMSHCPYGLQIEKGILPVLNLLDGYIDFEFKFVSYAMHGQKEINEQVRQYCIQENQQSKLYDYLSCFLEAGDSSGCIASAEINNERLDICLNDTDAEFNITEDYNNQATWINGRYPVFNIDKADNEKYNVTGSPTLIINGERVTTKRDSTSLLNKICSYFENAPEECSNQLSGTTPSPGFGNTTNNTEAGTCS